MKQNNSKLPFNIELLTIDKDVLNRIGKVNSMSIFTNETNSFHPEGLFSTEIFGLVGSEYRNRAFGYIDLKCHVLHPLIYDVIIRSVAWYDEILSGKTYAVWNKVTKAFDKSNQLEGETGYDFFFSHIIELKLASTESSKRDFNIRLFNKSISEESYKMSSLVVMPAGLRDYIIDKSGKPSEDEINPLYRKIFIQTTLIEPNLYKVHPEYLKGLRYTIQKNLLELYEYIKSLLEGKNKLILGKWLTRKTFNSTRNVASSNIEKVKSINDPNRLKYNEAAVGLHQFLKLLVPKSIYDVKNGILANIFVDGSNIATLTNIKTLKKETILLADINKDYDLFMSSEGIEKLISNFSNLNTRHNVVTLNKGKNYLALVYNDGKYFKVIQDIDDVPEHFDKSKVKPITMAEFLYLSIYKNDGKFPAFITRYPISSYGSIYPAYVKLKTTIPSLQLTELDDNWEITNNIANSYPIPNIEFFNTTATHASHNARLGLDYDGDTISVQMVLSDEAVTEVTNMLNNKEYYITPDNKFYFSISNDILNVTLAYMTA